MEKVQRGGWAAGWKFACFLFEKIDALHETWFISSLRPSCCTSPVSTGNSKKLT